MQCYMAGKRIFSFIAGFPNLSMHWVTWLFDNSGWHASQHSIGRQVFNSVHVQSHSHMDRHVQEQLATMRMCSNIVGGGGQCYVYVQRLQHRVTEQMCMHDGLREQQWGLEVWTNLKAMYHCRWLNNKIIRSIIIIYKAN